MRLSVAVFLSIISIFIVRPIFAADASLDTIVVTATRTDSPAKEVASSITVISAKEIENRQKTTVLEALRNVPGLDVVQNGGEGGTTSIFIRGAESSNTLVLIDGVEANDPISTGRGFNFANLTVDNIGRIEILRGPQSALYGSDTMGGVINIITKKGKGKATGFVSAEGGSFGTFSERAGVSGGGNLLNYSVGVSRLDTDGISSAGEKYGNKEKDGYGNTTLSGRLGLNPAENFGVDVFLRYINAKSDIDNCGGTGCDDPNNVYATRQLFFRTEAHLSLFKDQWEQTLGLSLADHDITNNNDKDSAHPADLVRSSFESRSFKADWQHNIRLHEKNTLTLGVESETEAGKSKYYSESIWGPYTSEFNKKTARTTGYYLQDQIKLKDLFLTFGLRLDEHAKFGNETTYRLGAAYFIQDGTKIKATYGTGFKAPSLFQLYSSYGDENLTPEKSKGWDMGIEQEFLEKKLTLGATYFRNDFEDLIDFDSATSKYKNIKETASKGVELLAAINPYKDVKVQASHTYTDTEDKATGKSLLRRPKQKSSLDINCKFLEKGDLDLGIVRVGKRDELDYSSWPAKRITLDGYTLVNIASSYGITENLKVFAKVDNLFNEDYEEIKGYGTEGVAAYAGLKASF